MQVAKNINSTFHCIQSTIAHERSNLTAQTQIETDTTQTLADDETENCKKGQMCLNFDIITTSLTANVFSCITFTSTHDEQDYI